ncbi:hypothetical protein FNV43_RR21654 [Rhamnella rubrinervis]|uniref:Retrotransposon gag domain-containing protein n=1 Tax=Rhamnella rubrinervis TaxID=2594499 RepID=A0A8K0DV06_9ROSA|nr:hypothetical protein FNV43_RR21654 [Rhamnella rubrinervis]
MVYRVSRLLCRMRDTPIVESVATSAREQVIGPHSMGVTFREDVPSFLGEGYRDIGLGEDSTQRELERRRISVAILMLWAQFKTLFYAKVFRRVKREDKEAEFLSLKQENLSLVEYERKFNELSHYAPYLVDTKECKARIF